VGTRRHRLAAATALATTTAVLGAGCFGGSSGGSGAVAPESSADFVKRITVEFSRGQSGRLWSDLLPADQRIVSRARFVACDANEGWNLKSIKVLETYDDPVDVGAKSLPSKAVTVRVTSDDGVTTATMHAVSVGGKWRWVLQSSDRAAYETGKCPRSG
jgi:hypothetical protein